MLMGEKEKQIIQNDLLLEVKKSIYDEENKVIDKEIAFYKLKHGAQWLKFYQRDMYRLAIASHRLNKIKNKTIIHIN